MITLLSIVKSYQRCMVTNNMIKYVFLSILLLVSIPITFAQTNEIIFCNKVSEDNPIFVTTDKENYDNGDIISVSGCLAPKCPDKGS